MKTLISIVCIALLVSCSSDDPYKKLSRLSGLWETHNGESILYEEWSKQDDNVMRGKSYIMNGPDTMIFERMELKKQGDQIFYIPTVKENNNVPVSFRLIYSDTSFIFENKQHDFPQRVIYKFIGKDSIAAKIEGLRNGVNESAEFNFTRIK